jgi:hypothetical protein
MSKATGQERRWASAIESGEFGVWDLDPYQQVVHYSPEWKARLGFSHIHGPDSTWSWRCRVHPDDFKPMVNSLQSHLDGTAPTYEARFRLRVNGSGYRTVMSRGRVVARDEQGNATQMVGTMVDLTDRPVATAMRGLASEGPRHGVRLLRSPFHELLSAARPHAADSASSVEPCAERRSAAATQSRHLIAAVDDLLEKALREASAFPRQPRRR